MNLDRVTQIYTALSRYEIELDPDPLTRGPKYLQGVTAQCRNYLNAVSQLMLEVHQEKQILARQLRARETAFQASFDHMLANDERVRRLPNIEDRKSTCRIFLRDDLREIDGIKAQTGDLEFVEKAIRHRHRELTATMNEIKLQKGLVQAELATGAFYGDERVAEDGASIGSAAGRSRGPGPLGFAVEDVSEEYLDGLFEGEQRAYQAAQSAPEPTPAETPVAVPAMVDNETALPAGSEPTEDDILAFLGAAEEVAGSVPITDDDFDSLFQNI